MYYKYFILISSITILNLVFSPKLNATCGAGNCFVLSGNKQELATKKQFTFDLTYSFIAQKSGLNGNDKISGSPLVAAVEIEKNAIVLDEHRESATTNQSIQLDMGYGLTDRITFGMSLPWVSRQHDHVIGLGESTAGENERWIASSLGDLRLMTHYGLVNGDRVFLSIGGGLELPTGDYTIRNKDGNIQEPTLQPGRGTYGLLASLVHTFSWIPNRLSHIASLSYRHSFENRYNYTFGDEFIFSGGIKVLVKDKINLITQFNAKLSGRDQFKGKLEQAINGMEVDLDESIVKRDLPNTGSTIVMFSPGVSIDVTKVTQYYVHIQVPIFRSLNEQNLAPGIGIITGVSFSF